MAKPRTSSKPKHLKPSQGTRFKGGYHDLPRAKKPSKLVRYGHQGSGFNRDTYHNEVYMRTGHYGSPAKATKYRSHARKSWGGLGVGAAGLGAAHIAHKTGHYKAAIGLAGASIAGSGYSLYHSAKGQKQFDRDTGTKRSMLYGYYHPNNRNAKTGVRSSKPTPVRSGGRVRRK